MFMFHAFALFHHTFVCLCIQGTCTISPYCVYLCIHAFALFHHISMFMYPSYLHYFTILLYVYVSTFMYYFTVHINRARYVSILICYFTIHLKYVYVSMFLLYFTIFLCLCIQATYTISPYYYVFMYPCFHSISPYFYVYVSKLLALFHHIFYMFMYPYIHAPHMNTDSLKIVSLIL